MMLRFLSIVWIKCCFYLPMLGILLSYLGYFFIYFSSRQGWIKSCPLDFWSLLDFCMLSSISSRKCCFFCPFLSPLLLLLLWWIGCLNSTSNDLATFQRSDIICSHFVWNFPSQELIGAVAFSSPSLPTFGTLSSLVFRLSSTYLPSKGGFITTSGTKLHKFFMEEQESKSPSIKTIPSRKEKTTTTTSR